MNYKDLYIGEDSRNGLNIEKILWEFRIRAMMSLIDPMENNKYTNKNGFNTYETGYKRNLECDSTLRCAYKDTYSTEGNKNKGVEILSINYFNGIYSKLIQKVYSYCGEVKFSGINEIVLEALEYVLENYTNQFRNVSNLAHFSFYANEKKLRGQKIIYITKMENENTLVEQIFNGDLLLWECKFTELI